MGRTITALWNVRQWSSTGDESVPPWAHILKPQVIMKCLLSSYGNTWCLCMHTGSMKSVFWLKLTVKSVLWHSRCVFGFFLWCIFFLFGLDIVFWNNSFSILKDYVQKTSRFYCSGAFISKPVLSSFVIRCQMTNAFCWEGKNHLGKYLLSRLSRSN